VKKFVKPQQGGSIWTFCSISRKKSVQGKKLEQLSTSHSKATPGVGSNPEGIGKESWYML